LVRGKPFSERTFRSFRSWRSRKAR